LVNIIDGQLEMCLNITNLFYLHFYWRKIAHSKSLTH